MGIGTTTPWGKLSLNPNGTTGPEFFVGTTTTANFLVTNGGKVGIGIGDADHAVLGHAGLDDSGENRQCLEESKRPRHVFVQGRYAYVASYTNNDLVIFDISRSDHAGTGRLC